MQLRLQSSQIFRKFYLIGLVVLIALSAIGQQDPQFSLNRFNQLTVNPAVAGNSGLVDLFLLNRFQWLGFPGAPVTTLFNADTRVHALGAEDGLGISMMNDALGFEKNISFNLSYAYRTTWKGGKLSSGVSVGFLNKNLNLDMTGIEGSNLINLSDPALPQGKASGVALDLGVGINYLYRNFDLSFSVKHLTQPKITMSQSAQFSMRRSYYASGTYKIQMENELWQTIPSLFLKSDGATWQADLGLTFLYDKRFWGGCGYRYGDALIVQGGAELWNGIKFGYAYDLSLFGLSKYNAGSHEFFLAYSVFLYKKKPHPYKSVRFL